LSFDYDTDPQKRRETPDFYGYVPDESGKRFLIIIVMTLNSSLLLLIRCFSAALLMSVKKSFFLWYLAGDMGFYLLQKAVRGDFHHWSPVDGLAGIGVTIIMRVMIKTITDFTGLIQTRGSGELGGIYWTGNMILALASAFLAAKIFFLSVGRGERVGEETSEAGLDSSGIGEAGLEENRVFTWLGSATGLWLFLFGVFLKLMIKKYRKTFFSRETGKEWAMSYFLKGDSDAVKAGMLTINKKLWAPIREETKVWVLSNWLKWKEEKPEWFVDSLIAKLPDDFVPEQENRAVLQEVRRKSSVFGGIAGTRLTLNAAISPVIVGGDDGSGGATLPAVEEEPGLGEHFDAVTEEEGGEKGADDGIVYVPADDEPDEKS
jgi:hypothetical protein